MHPCAVLLEQALDCARREEDALLIEDTEQADELADQRADLLHEAWHSRDGFDAGELLALLCKMEGKQERLRELAAALYDKMSAQLTTANKQGKYFSGSRYRIAQSEKSYYCNKVS